MIEQEREKFGRGEDLCIKAERRGGRGEMGGEGIVTSTDGSRNFLAEGQFEAPTMVFPARGGAAAPPCALLHPPVVTSSPP
ncbi:unnamed protein product [Prunus armeniaca]